MPERSENAICISEDDEDEDDDGVMMRGSWKCKSFTEAVVDKAKLIFT